LNKRSARSMALDMVSRVVDEGGYSTLVVRSALRETELSSRDRSFAVDLAYGTIRHLLTLDRAISICSDRPVRRMTPGIANVLRLGAYQLLFAGVPAHAAVGETVELAGSRQRGFVNAILRRMANEPPPLPVGGSDDEAAIRTGMAAWMIRELRQLLSDEAEAAAEAFATRAPLSLRANTCVVSPEKLEEALRGSGHSPVRSSIDPDCMSIEGADPSKLPGFAQGWFAVQDVASVAVVRALDPRPGDKVADVCAAPGGKASLASCLVGQTGIVVAGDVRPARTGLIGRTAERLRVGVRVLEQDGAHPALRAEFDSVLVDAPCSGIGSSRRRPELLWRPRVEGLSELGKLQLAIATGAAALLRPGGRLVYSVCTFPRVETDAVADAILRRCPDLEPAAITGPDGPAERFRLWPHVHGTDGMFVAGFRWIGR
jgi:16S rRNA (cytosine967-C5)-methyltransferase